MCEALLSAWPSTYCCRASWTCARRTNRETKAERPVLDLEALEAELAWVPIPAFPLTTSVSLDKGPCL